MFVKYMMTPQLYRLCKEIKEGKKDKHHNELMRGMKKYKNIHNGERCFILGNGPSLNALDFASLKNEFVFSVNQLPRHPDFAKLETNYHLWSDEFFFKLDENLEEDMEIVEIMKRVKTDDSNPVVFYDVTADDMIRHFNLDSHLKIEYFKNLTMNLDIILKKPLDMCHSIPNMPTVVHSAIFIAVYMGFSEIYLLGCDCTGFISIAKAKLDQLENIEYGYNMTKNEENRMNKVYSKLSMRNELVNAVEVFDRYAILHKYCERNGTLLYNATKGGLLESIPRVKLDEVLARTHNVKIIE